MFAVPNLKLYLVLGAAIWLLAASGCHGGNVEFPNFEDALGDTKSFHISAEVEFSGGNGRYLIEEWGAYQENRFRLDYILDADTYHQTALTYGETGEIFFIEPYNCRVVDENETELFENPFELFFATNSEHIRSWKATDKLSVLYGIRPFLEWAASTGQCKRDLSFTESNKVAFEINYSNNRSAKFIYDVSKGEQLQGKIPELIMWFKYDEKKKSSQLLAQARIMLFEQVNLDSTSIFDLPTGYGCERSDKLDHPLNINVKMGFLPRRIGSQAQMSLTTVEFDAKSRSASRRELSLRVLRDSSPMLDTKAEYYVIDVHEPSTQYREKTIWELRKSSNSLRAPLVITIDVHGRCKFERVSGDSKPALQVGAQLNLSLDAITELIENHENFHLIKERKERPIIRDLIYERRFEANQFKYGNEDQLLWPGVVSAVKRLHLYEHKLGDRENSRVLSGLDKYDSSLELHFYSDSDATKLKSRAKLSINSLDYYAAGHKVIADIDLGVCFDEDVDDYFDTSTNSKHLDAVVRYQMDSRKNALALENRRDLMQTKFVLSLLETTQISPLQLSNVRLELSDEADIRFKLRLLDLPLTLTSTAFKYKLKHKPQSSSLRHNTISAEKCGELCRHHSCPRFSWDSDSKECVAEMYGGEPLKKEKSQTSLLYELHPDPSISLVKSFKEFRQIDHQTHIIRDEPATDQSIEQQALITMLYARPVTLIRILDEYINYCWRNVSKNPGDTKTENRNGTCAYDPLEILMPSYYLDYFNNFATAIFGAKYWLRPLSVSLDEDSLSELVAEEEGDTRNALEQDFVVEPEYELHSEDKRLVKSVVKSISRVSNYENCEYLCADMNCRSFSYCATSNECELSELIKTEELNNNVEHADHCSVFILNALSKFEHFENIASRSPMEFIKPLSRITPLECAQRCLEKPTADKICESILYCKNNVNPAADQCYLQSWRPSEDHEVTNYLKPPKDNTGKTCDLYLRSYLSDYDQKYGAKIDRPSLVAEQRVDSEHCARKCSRSKQPCGGFHVCNTIDDSGKVVHTCAMDLTGNEIGKGDVVRDAMCTVFVSPAKEGDLTPDRKTGGGDKDDQVNYEDDMYDIYHKDPVNYKRSKITGSNSSYFGFFSVLVWMSLGVAAGAGLVYVWRRHEAIIERGSLAWAFARNRLLKR